ncbi:hypothetical protein Q31b_28810 [Novipirellula aureliae]|uniref:Thioredoxin domain-containing protein n=1 Tax=Novipirellula aureliae TaxID=2527966 RepID=A0A5C6DYX5_9BACT|nr:hypothetical protein [Novipirellula aureliae]TWU41434.1 hypothetical protein Q31b_28810 [Novipirellula aureliae]
MSRLFYGSMFAFALVATPSIAGDTAATAAESCPTKACCSEAQCSADASSCSAEDGALVECTTEVDSLKEGDALAAFHVTKIAGAADDGVDQGQELCYRCRYGSRPMVLVFARDTGGSLPEFLKQLDSAVADHEDAKLKGLVTLLGDDSDALKANAEKLAETASSKHVPVVIAKETKTGPAKYKLSSDAAITVVVAKDSKVVSSKTFAADQIDVASVMSDVAGMLN